MFDITREDTYAHAKQLVIEGNTMMTDPACPLTAICLVATHTDQASTLRPTVTSREELCRFAEEQGISVLGSSKMFAALSNCFLRASLIANLDHKM